MYRIVWQTAQSSRDYEGSTEVQTTDAEDLEEEKEEENNDEDKESNRKSDTAYKLNESKQGVEEPVTEVESPSTKLCLQQGRGRHESAKRARVQP